MAARIVGARTIIGVDRIPRRLALARELGATHCIDNRTVDVGESRVKRNSRAASIAAIMGGGVDYVIETTGELCESAIDVLNPRGKAAFLTGASGPEHLPGGRKVLSVIQGDAVPQQFIPKLIKLYRDGEFPFDRLVKFYDFEKINQAVADARRGGTIKPVLRIRG
jgi:aryl-alcohol dehydrogenase